MMISLIRGSVAGLRKLVEVMQRSPNGHGRRRRRAVTANESDAPALRVTNDRNGSLQACDAVYALSGFD